MNRKLKRQICEEYEKEEHFQDRYAKIRPLLSLNPGKPRFAFSPRLRIASLAALALLVIGTSTGLGVYFTLRQSQSAASGQNEEATAKDSHQTLIHNALPAKTSGTSLPEATAADYSAFVTPLLSKWDSYAADFVYSPLSHYAASQTAKLLSDTDYSAEETHLKDLNAFANQTMKDGSLTSASFAASTYPIKDGFRSVLSDTGITTLENGSVEALNLSLQDYIFRNLGEQFDFALSGEGVYAGNCLALDDSYSPTKERTAGTFAGKNGTEDAEYISDCTYGGFYQGDGYMVASLQIRNTQMVILLPDSGKEINNYSLKQLQDDKSKMTKGKVNSMLPEFSFHGKAILSDILGTDAGYSFQNVTDLASGNSALVQFNDFSYSAKGVRGRTLSVAYPTSTGPETVGSFKADRPFLFGLYDGEEPLYFGKITTL